MVVMNENFVWRQENKGTVEKKGDKTSKGLKKYGGRECIRDAP
jgi:hypothetical protein